MLWACIHLPQLPLEVYQLADHRHRQGMVIESTTKNSRHVSYLNEQARRAGILEGTSIPTALSLLNGLIVKKRNVHLEQQALVRIATVCYQFTPTVSIRQDNSVLLELSGSLRLFGGSIHLCQQLTQQLAQTGHLYQLAFCETPSSAHILAKANTSQSTLPEDYFFNLGDLAPLPVHLLDIPQKHIELLNDMGLSQLNDLFILPKDAVAKRFGTDFMAYIDKLTGNASDPQPLFQLPERFDQNIDLTEELTHINALIFPIKHLTQALQQYLIARQLCVQSFILLLKERHQQQQSLVIQLSKPHYESEHFLTLIRHQLDRINLQQPVTGFHLKARHFVKMNQTSQDLFDTHQQPESNRYELIDTLKAKLGEANVWGLSLTDDHRPECASQSAVPGQGQNRLFPADHRPIWLLDKPQRLNQKKGLPVYHGMLQLLKGPERIETGWWDLSKVNRDYYIAQHPGGATYWVFKDREKAQQWFLHGVFN